MLPPLQDLYRIAPEIVLCTFGMLVMFLAPILPKARHGVLSTISLLGAGLALASTRLLALYPGPAYSGLLRSDAFSLFVHLIVCGVAFLRILGSATYLKREHLDAGEFCALILFATAGMGVMASAQELLTALIGLEMSSIESYVLASYKRDAPRSNEAAMKYFLLGSFASAFFLYGIALTYGATGTTHLDLMGQAGAQTSATLLKMGLGLVFVGLAFKVAAAPFQLWTPDVYEGAPAPVTAMLSTGPKAAAFALALRILVNVEAASAQWGGTGERHVEIEDFTGLARRQPAMAACLSLFLLSLLGLPVAAGFLGKFYVFNAALESNLIWLAILLALNSVIGAYYYLRVIVAMYMREPAKEIAAGPVPWPLAVVLWITASGTIYVRLFPTRLIDFAAKAALNMR